jgi:hypothetical protein
VAEDQQLPAWESLSDYDRVWDSFGSMYSFKPSFDGERAIEEPLGSITFGLVSQVVNRWPTWTVHAVNALVVAGMTELLERDEPLIVLDWQHPAYHFWPQRTGLYDQEGAFPHGVFPWPDGDYYAFLSADMTQGTFGHPWAETICVFGDRLTPLLSPHLELLLPVVRRR